MNLIQEAADRIGRRQPTTVEDRALLARLAKLGARDGFTLTHALRVAAERFDHDAEQFVAQKAESERILEENPNARPMFLPRACDQLEAQFRQQAADVRELLAVIEGYDEEAEEAA